MHHIDQVADRIRATFDASTAARDKALAQARTLTRHCANAIRAVNRDEHDLAKQNLDEASQLAESLKTSLAPYPELYFAGYTQDALKEFSEANVVYYLVVADRLPDPEELGLEHATYLQGVAEAAGEMRRRCLDMLRRGNYPEAEKLLAYMDDIYAVLITMDYP
ncbi:MAG: haloacid dehalogenase, partial [Anaerolineales bacterium]|nr:haloacid dehalogenase [Anaerolineales bacterium]